jgi:TM2 domain-containing membrane protein YozV
MNLCVASEPAPPPTYPAVASPAPQLISYQQPGYAPQPVQVLVVQSTNKSKLAAGLLALFLGTWGIHRFYLGYNGIGLTLLFLWLGGWITCGITTIIAGIWGNGIELMVIVR